MSKRRLPPFDPYVYYQKSVQSPEQDVQLLARIFRNERGRRARVLREDFCGAFANCCAWVSTGSDRIAHGVDLDPEPIEWGRRHNLVALKPADQRRIHLHQDTVLNPRLPKADLICAMNFSYFIFKERQTLKQYFKSCLAALASDGVMVLDFFGGPATLEASVEKTRFREEGFTYIWEQESYEPLNAHAMFAIHFKRDGEKVRRRVFRYDWRMWTLPELKDLLLESGFRNVEFYWEGSTPDGRGDGHFFRAAAGEECESYIAYLAALK